MLAAKGDKKAGAGDEEEREEGGLVRGQDVGGDAEEEQAPPQQGEAGGTMAEEEAAAQAQLLSRETPLKGGESVAMEQLGDFGGVTPRPQATPTPNAIASGLTPAPGARGARGSGAPR